jgi:hypothetical protein
VPVVSPLAFICHSGVHQMSMHCSVLARAQESSCGPVVVCKPASDLLGMAAQASCDVSSDAVTWKNRAGTICQLDSLGAAAVSRPAAGQDHLPAAADVSTASRKLDLEGGPLHDMHIARTGCTGSKRRRRSPLTANRRTTDPLPAHPAADRIGSTDGCALAGASSEHPGSSRDAAQRPRRPAPAYRNLALQPRTVSSLACGAGGLLRAVEIDLGQHGVAHGRCVPIARGAACLVASVRGLMSAEFSEGAVDQAMQAAGARIWTWVSRSSRSATISSGQPACAMLWRRTHSGTAGPDRSGGAEIMLLATGASWQRRGLAACVVSHLCALVAGAAPGHPCAALSARAALPFWVKSGFAPAAEAFPPVPNPPHVRSAAAAQESPSAARFRARGVMPLNGSAGACFLVVRECAAAYPGAPDGAVAALLSLSGGAGPQCLS